APLAWLVSRTNVPCRGLIRLCVLGAFVTPGFVNALSWTLLAGPNAGVLNKLWMSLTGASSGLINIFSMPGLVLVSLATIYPVALGVIVLTFVLPNLVLLNASFLRHSFRGFSFDNLTLRNYAFVLFSYEAGMLSMRNSLVTSGLAASVAVVLTAVAAYLAERKI